MGPEVPQHTPGRHWCVAEDVAEFFVETVVAA